MKSWKVKSLNNLTRIYASGIKRRTHEWQDGSVRFLLSPISPLLQAVKAISVRRMSEELYRRCAVERTPSREELLLFPLRSHTKNLQIFIDTRWDYIHETTYTFLRIFFPQISPLVIIRYGKIPTIRDCWMNKIFTE